MPFLARFRRTKADPETTRRAQLLRAGRIGEATVLGTDPDDQGNLMLSHNYTVGGVDYQSFQRLDDNQLQRKRDYLPGASVPLRYDPHRPANSVVV